jgi:hypothetical protein
MASLGKPFIEAGIRFYEKLLKKNVAIRELTGDDGQFTAMGKVLRMLTFQNYRNTFLGNENFMIRTKTLPLTLRKTFFELKLKELEAAQTSSI